jgi:hypothetical protein
MVTVPVERFPPVTVLGFSLIEVTLMPGVRVTVPCAVLFEPFGPLKLVTVTDPQKLCANATGG